MVIVKYNNEDERRYAGIVRHVCSIASDDSPLDNSRHLEGFYQIASQVPGCFRCGHFDRGLGKLERTLEVPEQQ